MYIGNNSVIVRCYVSTSGSTVPTFRPRLVGSPKKAMPSGAQAVLRPVAGVSGPAWGCLPILLQRQLPVRARDIRRVLRNPARPRSIARIGEHFWRSSWAGRRGGGKPFSAWRHDVQTMNPRALPTSGQGTAQTPSERSECLWGLSAGECRGYDRRRNKARPRSRIR